MLDGKKIKNKKIDSEDVETKEIETPIAEVGQQIFFFPDYNLTIKADSRQEAEILLAETLRANK